VQPIVSLMADLADLAPAGRVEHLLSSMARIFGARMTSSGVAELMPDETLRPVAVQSFGLEQCDRTRLAELMYDSRGSQLPMAPYLAGKIRSREQSEWTFDRRAAFDDHEWYHSPVSMEYCRALRVDECLYAISLVPGAPQAVGFGLSRPWGDRRPFTSLDRKLLELLLLGTRNMFLPRGPRLPRRQRQVLELLLAGRSVKQVAFELEISVHTAEEHVSALYRKFNVSGRHELMARFVK
jgi:DNA-binding CsgD family transcriptional regulator